PTTPRARVGDDDDLRARWQDAISVKEHQTTASPTARTALNFAAAKEDLAMLTASKFFAFLLLIALAYAAAHVQAQSRIVSGHYEREFVLRPTKSIRGENRLLFGSIGGTSATGRSTAVAGGTLTTAGEAGQTHLLAASGGAVSWPQWGHDPSHNGSINVVGQSPNQVVADIIYDPFVEQEKASGERVLGEADLFVHYQTPLVDGNDVFMEF